MRVSLADVRTFRSHLRRLERVVNAHSKRCCSEVSQSQCHVLLQIDIEGETTTKELSEALSLDASTISRTVDSLVREQLAARKENAEDRRSLLLYLTARGKRLAQSINSDADAFYAKVLQRIPHESRAAILKGFEDLVQAMNRSEGDKNKPSCCCGSGDD